MFCTVKVPPLDVTKVPLGNCADTLAERIFTELVPLLFVRWKLKQIKSP